MPSDNYLLGHETSELERLEAQAQALAPATQALVRLAGVRPGMRVLELGSGAGDVALLLADVVGPEGTVVGVDRSPDALAWARRRAEQRQMDNVSFVAADLDDFDLEGSFDAIVGRLILLYLERPTVSVRRLVGSLRPSGVALFMEYDMHAAGHQPSFRLSARVVDWIIEAYEASGHDPALGPHLGPILQEAGLPAPTVLGFQTYLPAGDARGGHMMAGVIRSLIPTLEGQGIADRVEIDVDSLGNRVNDEAASLSAYMTPPTLVGAWATLPG